MLHDFEGQVIKSHKASLFPGECLFLELWTSLYEVQLLWNCYAGEVTWRRSSWQSQLRPSFSQPSPDASHWSEETLLEWGPPASWLQPQFGLSEAPDTEKQIWAVPTVPCLNSWPTGSVSRIKRCLMPLCLLCSNIWPETPELETGHTYEKCHCAALFHPSKLKPKSYWWPYVHERQYDENLVNTDDERKPMKSSKS